MKKHSPRAIRVVCYGLAVLTLACTRQPAPDTRAADEAAIREAEAACLPAAAAKQVEAMVDCYYADEASLSMPNTPIAAGKEAILQTWTQAFQSPGFSVSWQPLIVDVARSGDLGYSKGNYETTMNDPKGNPVTNRGKYVTVWKKQADGSWKAVADIGNSIFPPRGQPAR